MGDNSLTCKMCGSNRVIKGPFYDPNDIVCWECGHREEGPGEIHYAKSASEKEQERAEQVTEDATKLLDDFANVDMTDPEQAEAYLAKLKANASALNKTGGQKKPGSPKAKKNAAKPAPVVETESDLDDDLIMMDIHVYQRRGSSWQQTISDAKGEKEFRNDNVLVYAHEHGFRVECTNLCKQIT